MATSRSVDEVLARLREQVSFHGEQETFHAAQEIMHREERSAHAAALEEARRRLEAFQAAAVEALDLTERNVPPKRQIQDPKDEDLGTVSRPKLVRMVWLILDAKRPDERFGANGLSREVNQHFRDRLRRAVDVPQMSVVLRRLHRRGRIHQVRPGRPHQEALYVREKPAGEDQAAGS
ncbi:MAG TPA: hypothetical protein VN493_28185 [Thermoanaerobaculia bacterium]|nr:hypothetical protein [Thermoanaerobaculia bacterium]